MLLIPPLLASALLLPATRAVQIPFIATSPTSPPERDSLPLTAPDGIAAQRLTLRHAFHAPTAERHKPLSQIDYDRDDLASISSLSPYSTTQTVRTKRLRTHQPSSQDAFHAARRTSFARSMRTRYAGTFPTREHLADQALASTLEWNETEIEAPDTSDVDTLAALGKMTSNAYTTPDASGWYDIGGGWNRTDSFGWKEHGIRGHVFADDQNKTVVVAIKGTSAFLVGGGTETSKNDKINDNLLFSCCCARVDWSWSTVCDCYDSPYTCRQDCLEHAVMTKSAYYPVAIDLYNNISAIYPHSQIWLTGHSLGGGLAAMLSRTYGVPSVSFESPGDLLPARRLHLPLPPRIEPNSSSDPDRPARRLQDELTTHIFHTADPIPMGVCTGTISTCAIGGFALESRCHSGKTILYDTVGRLSWSVDIRTHPIHIIIDYLLKDDWGVKPRNLDGATGRKRSWLTGWWPGKGRKEGDEPEDDKEGDDENESDGQRKGRGVPKARFEEDDCEDCFKWSFIDG
ncbi:lipase family protein [Sporobolomyces koalae]|uniref:lipase family protein n=1 Tax=Sporobolomyces koalae TaxID=500713 RepID=UPI00316CC827